MSDDLAQRPEQRNGGGIQTCPACDGSWWSVQAIVLDHNDKVTGYAAPVTCRDCGHVLVDGPTPPPIFEIVKETP